MRCHRAGAPQRKQLDEWDAEYDRGKQKKVKGRRPDEWEDGGNRFQDAWNSCQHAGGRHHKQVERLSHHEVATQEMDACCPSVCLRQGLGAVMSICCDLFAQPPRGSR